MNMEHMLMRWNPEYNNSDGTWNIVTDDSRDPWYVASIPLYLPGDESGEKTCRAICDAHNAEIGSSKEPKP